MDKMKFRIMYWLGCMTTDCYVCADNIANAVRKFEEIKGKKRDDIIRIDLVNDKDL
jgi:hypothetical protein